MNSTTSLEEVLLAEELDVVQAIALLDDAAQKGATPGLSLLERCFAHPDASLRAAAHRTLRGAKSLQALKTLMTGLDDPSEIVVAAAADAILESEDAGPHALVTFHRRAAARRENVRRTTNVDHLYLLLADADARDEVIERLQQHLPIGRSGNHAAIVKRMLIDGTLPAADAARLFRADADSAGLLAMQIAESVIEGARGEPEIVYDRPKDFAQLRVADLPPPVLVMLIEWLDALPGGWRALLAHRHIVNDKDNARTAFLIWLSLTVHAARVHASRGAWTRDALIVESTRMPWLFFAEEIPLETRRVALRWAAGLTGRKIDPTAFDWDGAFVAACLKHPVARRESGAHDLLAAYALLDVLAGGWPLKAIHEKLGKAAILQAAAECPGDLAWMIAATAIRRSDHLIALQWLETIAADDPATFVEVTRTLPLSFWNDITDRASERVLEGLLTALAASDLPPMLWSTWASSITGAGPSVSAVLEAAGYRAVRPETALFPRALSAAQQAEAKRVGIPPIIEHQPSGIVLVLIPGGECVIGGSDEDPDAYPREKPARTVMLEPFYLAVSPITQGQVAQRSPGFDLPFHDQPNVPARGLNWKTASEFLAKLECGMRLPSESEWERAARAGSASRYWWGHAFKRGMVNCQDEFPTARVTPVSAFPANPWGLLDILGNVWEWCEEWFSDPTFPSGKRWRVLRGGSWFHERWNARVSERYWGEPEGVDAIGVCGVRPAADLSICFEVKKGN